MSKQTISEKASYLRDLVFSANDGIITTFAVIAGAQGAGISTRVVIILGLSNLFADGISMASGNYLGTKSEQEYKDVEYKHSNNKKDKIERAHKEVNLALDHSAAVLLSFIVAGSIPLLPFLIGLTEKFTVSMILVVLSLFALGIIRSKYNQKSIIGTSLETMVIGGTAAIVAYGVGHLLEGFIA